MILELSANIFVNSYRVWMFFQLYKMLILNLSINTLSNIDIIVSYKNKKLQSTQCSLVV